VLTVVCKLLHLTRPDDAFFGEKDYQQLTLIRAMVTDLDLGVNVVGVTTVREEDGVALSSRNLYLTDRERAQAAAIPRALAAGAGHHNPVAIEQAARAELAGLDVDYAQVRSPDLAAPRLGEARLLVAVRLGRTRLLDNRAVEVDHL
jgi:pantoate--beta-alanine ligase